MASETLEKADLMMLSDMDGRIEDNQFIHSTRA